MFKDIGYEIADNILQKFRKNWSICNNLTAFYYISKYYFTEHYKRDDKND